MTFTPKFVDLVRNLTTSQGTGPVTLGAAVTGYTSFTSALSAGDRFYYCIQGVDKPAEREVGRGTLTSNGKVEREPIGGALTNFTNGSKTIALVTAAEWYSKVEEQGGTGPAAPGASGPWVNLADYLSPTRTPFVTDDLPAFNAALDAMKAMEVGDSGIPKLIIPAGRYYCSDTINIHCSCIIEGAGAGQDAGTLIRFAPNRNGIVVNHVNTHGDTVGSQGNAGGSTIRHLALWGGNVSVSGTGAVTSYAAGTSPAGHGIRIRGAFVGVKDVLCAFFGEDGFNINATAGSGGATEGNANSAYLERCQSIYNGRYGYLFNGNDANACMINCCSAISNGGCGFVEYSFLGNTYLQPHARDNGYADPTGNNGPVGVCTFGGQTYYVRADKLSQASTTTPGTDPSVWVQRGLLGGRAWVAGKSWVLPGGYATNPANFNARNVFIGTYGEAGQAPIQAQMPTVFFGGLVEEMGFDPVATTAWLRSGSYGFIAGKGFQTDRIGGWGALLGGAPDEMVRLDHSDGSLYRFIKVGGSMAMEKGGAGVIFYGFEGGIELPAGKAFRINGQQVVGARQAAIADAAAGQELAKINAILAAMRTHGLIAG